MKLEYTLLYVDDVAKTMDFYSRAFGLCTGFLHESQQYGEMITGETKLGFVNHTTAKSHGFLYDSMSLNKNPASFEIAFITDNVETAFEAAVSAGAIAISQPTPKPWGQIVAYLRDCNGFIV